MKKWFTWNRCVFGLALALVVLALFKGNWAEALAWTCTALAEWRLYNEIGWK